MSVAEVFDYLKGFNRARLRRTTKELVREINDDRVTGLSAEVAFFGVLSIFPGLLMIAAALGSIDILVGSDLAQEAEVVVSDFLNQILTEDASATVAAVGDLFKSGRGGVVTFSIVFALWSLSRGFQAAMRALNLAYDFDERRSWIKQRLTALVFALGSVIMVAFALALLVAGPLIGGGRAVADLVGLGDAFAATWDVVRWPLAFVLLVLWATTLYHFAPARRTRWLTDLPGAVLAGVMWLVVSASFAGYLHLSQGFNQVLGILGGGLILLVWLYLLAFALLVGGELNAVLAREQGKISSVAG
jgi:membrane protein